MKALAIFSGGMAAGAAITLGAIMWGFVRTAGVDPMHDWLLFGGGAIASQILATTIGLYVNARRKRRIEGRLGPPAP